MVSKTGWQTASTISHHHDHFFAPTTSSQRASKPTKQVKPQSTSSLDASGKMPAAGATVKSDAVFAKLPQLQSSSEQNQLKLGMEPDGALSISA